MKDGEEQGAICSWALLRTVLFWKPAARHWVISPSRHPDGLGGELLLIPAYNPAFTSPFLPSTLAMSLWEMMYL